MKTTHTRRLALGLMAAVAAGLLGPTDAQAHETNCPKCALPVVQDTAEQNNEVTLKFGRRRIDYRCVLCALQEAHSEYKGDLSILAPTATKGSFVLLKRAGDAWTASLERDGAWQTSDAVVFLAAPVEHSRCHIGNRAFASRTAFDAYTQKHKDAVGEAQPRTLAQLIELSRGGEKSENR